MFSNEKARPSAGLFHDLHKNSKSSLLCVRAQPYSLRKNNFWLQEVSGHDFSRAAIAQIKCWALAPEGIYVPCPILIVLLSDPERREVEGPALCISCRKGLLTC